MCGAADAFRAMSISPQVVSIFIVYFADLSMVIAGSFFQESDLTLPAAGFSHGSGALLGEALGVTSAPAFSFLPSSSNGLVRKTVTDSTTTTPRTEAITELRMRALRRV